MRSQGKGRAEHRDERLLPHELDLEVFNETQSFRNKLIVVLTSSLRCMSMSYIKNATAATVHSKISITDIIEDAINVPLQYNKT